MAPLTVVAVLVSLLVCLLSYYVFGRKDEEEEEVDEEPEPEPEPVERLSKKIRCGGRLHVSQVTTCPQKLKRGAPAQRPRASPLERTRCPVPSAQFPMLSPARRCRVHRREQMLKLKQSNKDKKRVKGHPLCVFSNKAHHGAVNTVCFSPNGKIMVTTCTSPRRLRLTSRSARSPRVRSVITRSLQLMHVDDKASPPRPLSAGFLWVRQHGPAVRLLHALCAPRGASPNAPVCHPVKHIGAQITACGRYTGFAEGKAMKAADVVCVLTLSCSQNSEC